MKSLIRVAALGGCIALAALAVTVARAGEEDEIVTGCHYSNAEWGIEMVHRCIKDNLANRELVLQYPARYKSYVARCRTKNEFGWDMVKACIDKDIEAEAALAAYPPEKGALVSACVEGLGERGPAAVKKCVERKSGETPPK